MKNKFDKFQREKSIRLLRKDTDVNEQDKLFNVIPTHKSMQGSSASIDVLHFTVTVPFSIMNKTYNSVINKKTTGDVILHVMVFVNNVNIQIFDR